MIKLIHRVALFASIVVLAVGSISAQNIQSTEVEQIQQEEQGDEFVPLSELKPLEIDHDIVNKHILDGGLTASNTYYVDSTLKNNLYIGFYRPYLRYILNETHEFMARGKMTLKHYQKKPNTGKQTSTVGALEVLQGRLNFGRHRVQVGRFFHRLGKGVLFSNYADGVEYSFLHPYFQAKVAGLYSAEYDKACALSLQGCTTEANPYDIIPNVSADTKPKSAGKRAFGTISLTSPALFGTRLYVLGLYSKDLIKDPSTGQKYAYNPWYAGGGLRGFIILPDLRYAVEGYYLGGKTHPKKGGTFKGSEEINIAAWAMQSEVKYTLPVLKDEILPTLIAQYAMGSGDKDRASLSSASAQDKSGKDTSFYYFGVYSAGLALKPELSNLQIMRFGFSLKPFQWTYDFRDVILVFKYSLYKKVIAEGVISDPLATEKNKDVGSAFDVSLIYKITSELNLYYGFGYFIPGKAYP
ncbi:MAG: hypothetical protein D6767_09725, partial [Candidatus Hydrogenedentota bacterium]